MKIKTIQTKVAALTKLNLDELDFEGLAANGKETKVSPEIKAIKKELSRFSRQLTQQEKKYLDQKFDHQLKMIFGQWVDFYNGDATKALAAMTSAVNGSARVPTAKDATKDITKNTTKDVTKNAAKTESNPPLALPAKTTAPTQTDDNQQTLPAAKSKPEK